jgi:integrase
MPVIERVWRSGPRKVKRTAWGYTVQIGAKQVRKFDALWSKDDAQQAMAARMLERDTPATTTATPNVAITFKQMIDRYLLRKKADKKITVNDDRVILARMGAYFGVNTPLTAITGPKIAEYRLRRSETISEMTGRQLAPGSVNRELAVLRHLLRMAASEDCEYLEKAPTVKLMKMPEGRLRYLTAEEAARLLDECRKAATYNDPQRRSPHLYPVVMIALHTGMRKGEILGLTWDRVDLSRGVFILTKTKAKRRREVPMNLIVYKVVSALPRTGPRLFGRSVRTAFGAAVKRAGLKDFHFHDLRHTFASWLTMKGRPLKEVSELLGHHSITMTERYAHLAPEHLKQAVAVLEDFSTWSAHEAETETAATVTAGQN